MANAILCLVASDCKNKLIGCKKNQAAVTSQPRSLSRTQWNVYAGLPEACAVAVCGGFLQHVVLVVSATLDASGQVSMCPRPARGWSLGWPRVGAGLHPEPSCPARLCLPHRHTQPAPCLPLISEAELLICECVHVCACSVVSDSLRPHGL